MVVSLWAINKAVDVHTNCFRSLLSPAHSGRCMTNDTLGLDWDGVISHFPQEMAILAAKFTNVVIITLNNSVTPEKAEAVLKRPVSVEICPDSERDNHGVWKATICRKHNVALIIDDDGFVVAECRSMGIPALAVNAMFFQTMLYEF